MLAPHLREVSVGEPKKRLAIAVSLTILDTVVAAYSGGVVWRAFSATIWSRLFVILLASLWATSLLNLWVRAYYDLRQMFQFRDAAVSSGAEILPAELVEDRDV
jgi:hypothetical protein